MSYAVFQTYQNLYTGDGVTEEIFNRLSWEADMEMDRQTTGVDNVRKLRIACPTDDDGAEAVRRCECALVHFMFQIEEAEKRNREANSFIEREDGTMQGKVVSSVSSGSESVSYSTKSTANTEIDAAAASLEARGALFAATVRKYLSGVSDANGVNLLYLGRYPYV